MHLFVAADAVAIDSEVGGPPSLDDFDGSDSDGSSSSWCSPSRGPG